MIMMMTTMKKKKKNVAAHILLSPGLVSFSFKDTYYSISVCRWCIWFRNTRFFITSATDHGLTILSFLIVVWLKTGTLVATMPGVWRYRVSARTGWPGNCEWMRHYSLIRVFCLNTSARTVVWTDPRPWDTFACQWDIEYQQHMNKPPTVCDWAFVVVLVLVLLPLFWFEIWSIVSCQSDWLSVLMMVMIW